jgi:2-hydroxy-3-keto-5-methylthiopentenyl-1-phosphate phosphatase
MNTVSNGIRTIAKPINDLLEFIDDWNKDNKDNKISFRQAVLTIHKLIDSSGVEVNYYNRFVKMRNGETTHLEPIESKAIYRYIHSLTNPLDYSKAFLHIDTLERKINTLEAYINKGYFNINEAKKIIKPLKALIPLSNESITESYKD